MLDKCKIISLPSFVDERGKLVSIEHNVLPFKLGRFFYIYDILGARGAHAHKTCEQFIIPMSGSFYVELKNGDNSKIYFLDNPASGLYITSMIWTEIHDFSKGAVCAVFASKAYNEEDYYRHYDDFIINWSK